MKRTLTTLLLCWLVFPLSGQHEHHQVSIPGELLIIDGVEPQPLIAQAVRIAEALDYVGSSLPQSTKTQLLSIRERSFDEHSVEQVQQLLDPFCLAYVEINPESRVKVSSGPVEPILVQSGWSTFLVKVNNEAGITADLVPESPNALPVLHVSEREDHMNSKNYLSPGDLDNRFIEMSLYQGRPLKGNLSGLKVEYFLIQFYTKARDRREVELGFNVGQGTQDIGFRNTIDILFNIKKSVKVVFDVQDHDGSPVIGSFIITDAVDRFYDISEMDYRNTLAESSHWMGWGEPDAEKLLKLPVEKRLKGIYPLPARRVATKDDYPDFYFQPQIYRTSGEHVYLPPGNYHITYGRGPEYVEQYTVLHVPADRDSIDFSVQLKRWVHMADLNWYSADHHIHAAGCSHYESPEEGVRPEAMWRQIQGEDLNMGNTLTWGPGWYTQKQNFTGENHKLSDKSNILRYDVEVSGFPSGHAGHLVLLNLKEDDYPGALTVQEWPSWTLPILKWAKGQGAITGYSHSGFGLTPVEATNELPNYVMPRMDGIGANEYVVTVTHGLIDFYSLGNTPLPDELNMWYHTLNSGFRIPASGETDFPCVSDEKIGRGRIYAKLDGSLEFDDYMDALVRGRSYVSTGESHVIDFKVNNAEMGVNGSILNLKKNQSLEVVCKAAAYLSETQDEIEKTISEAGVYDTPFWHVERSRVAETRTVEVELIVNGDVVDKKIMLADGQWNDLKFEYNIEQSSWFAIRIFGSAHSNPIFVHIDNEPVRIEESIQWCLDAVDQCWNQKTGGY